MYRCPVWGVAEFTWLVASFLFWVPLRIVPYFVMVLLFLRAFVLLILELPVLCSSYSFSYVFCLIIVFNSSVHSFCSFSHSFYR